MIVVSLVESVSVLLVFSYIYCWSPALPPLRAEPLSLRHRLQLFVLFAALTILGNHLGLHLRGGAIANTRAVGAVISGLLAGPTIGTGVGVIAGLERIRLGGITAVAGAVATSLEGLAAGLLHRRLVRRRPDLLLSWKTAAALTATGEIVHQLLLLLLSRPFAETLELVQVLAAPMILTNTVGSALFMVMLGHRRAVYEAIGASSSAFALRTARRVVDALQGGLGKETSQDVADVLREETGVMAVAITDTEKLLAWSGPGEDHHRVGDPIFAGTTRSSMARRDVVTSEQFRCARSERCPLGGVVVVPLQINGRAVGTVQLYEGLDRRVRASSQILGEGIAALISASLLVSRYREQEQLLLASEVKLLQAQVNPHFLFNALNTLVAVTRKDPERARELLSHLSTFLRKNLKRGSEVATLDEELEHVGSYLEIERARFGDRLEVETEVEPGLGSLEVPTFTLQPLVENAIRHGVGSVPGPGRTRIHAYRHDGAVVIDVEDDAGAYAPPPGHQGLGMNLVDRRIKDLAGEAYGVSVTCVPSQLTRVTVRLPADGIPRRRTEAG